VYLRGSTSRTFESLEEILNVDHPVNVQEYFKIVYLTLNKTTSIVYHLNNRESNSKLNLVVNITSNFATKY